jgi:exonuclease SbcC
MLTSVTAEANRLLSGVYGGRYRLYRTDEISGRSRKGGLELEVQDNQTGQRRSVTTLSGGEKFLVALSLAIGLSTVVQAQGHGMQLEAMFVDEGFGSLDRESVADALEVLQGISRSSGIVGIISHVDQLAETIPSKIRITKGKDGSRCSVIV